MLLSFDDIVRTYGAPKNVLHIGAHWGQEVPGYLQAGADRVHLFEPLTANIKRLTDSFGEDPRIRIYQTALGNDRGLVNMFVASNDGQSSSVLRPAKHMEQYPGIIFPTVETVTLSRLDSYGLYGADFINMDVQGYELEVLKGGEETLKSVRMVYCEVNRAELYENCVQVEELDAFLVERRFTQREISWGGGTWGDALYVRE